MRVFFFKFKWLFSNDIDIYLLIFHLWIYLISHGCLLNGRLVFLAVSAAASDYGLIEQGLSFKTGMNSIWAAGFVHLGPSRIGGGLC